MKRHIGLAVAIVAAALVASVLLVTKAANADGLPVTTTKHGVLKSTTLRDCRVASSVPCTLFDGLDSGWLDSDYVWHSVWMKQPRGKWDWATRAERQQYHLTLANQVQRVRGHVTLFRGPTGETWCNCPGYDSEHWPS